MVTLNDIAAASGESIYTVSRILRGKGKFNRPTMVAKVEKVRKVADALNYRPNAAARALKRQAFMTIGYFEAVEHVGGHSPIKLLLGAYEGLTEAGYGLSMINCAGTLAATADGVRRVLTENSIDALVVSNMGSMRHEAVMEIDAHPSPVVYANERNDHSAVYVDERSSALELTRRLIDRGLRRILFVEANKPSRHYSLNERRQGYVDAMTAAGLTPGVHLTDPSQAIDLRQLGLPASEPVGIIAWCDYGMLRIQRALQVAGLLDPAKVVCGSLGGDMAYLAAMPPIWMENPWEEMGRHAARMAVELASGSRQRCDSVVMQATYREVGNHGPWGAPNPA